MLAAKHFDPVMGVDIHMVTIPPTGPIPIPHPHISTVLDPMDYVPVFGGTVLVGGVPRATAGTAGTTIPHIPLGGPFPKPVGNEDEVFMGSATVKADDAPFTFTALPSLSCQDVGMIAPIRAKKPKKSYGMLLPLSNVISIPAGMPVLVGGPPTIDIMGLAMSGAFAALGAAAKKLRSLQKGSKRIKKISDAIHKKADGIMDKIGVPPNVRNKVHKGICTVTGHPVDVATGKVFTDATDFELQGRIPVRWERTYYSTSTYDGPLGIGWHHNFDLKLVVENRTVVVRMSDGRCVAFPAIENNEKSFDRMERMELERICNFYVLRTREGLEYWFGAVFSDLNSYNLVKITDGTGEVGVELKYNSKNLLATIKDSNNRIVDIEWNEEEKISRIYLPDPIVAESKFCVTKYEYDNSNLVKVIDAHNNSFSYKYTNNLLIQETDRNGLSFYFAYDSDNSSARCIKTWGDNGIYNHTLNYDVLNNITYVRDSNGYTTAYHHNQIVPLKTVDPSGGVRHTEYSEYYEILSRTDELGRKTTFEYDERGNNTKIIYPDSTEQSFKFDSFGNLIEIKDQQEGVWKWIYDKNKLIKKVDSIGRETCYKYNNSNLSHQLDTSGLETQISYDHHNNPLELYINGKLSGKFEWNNLGQLISETDEHNNTKYYKYDLLGRLSESKEADGNVRVFHYDLEGNLICATDNANRIDFQYSGLGKLVARVENGDTTRFYYDSEERLVKIVNCKGETYELTRGYRGEVSHEKTFDGVVFSYQRDLYGNVVKRTAPEHETWYEYDLMGRVIHEKHSDGCFSKFQYREDGELISAENENIQVKFVRDKIGRVISEIQGEEFVNSEYHRSGMRNSLKTSNGFDQVVKRDAFGSPTTVSFCNGDYTVQSERDSLGYEINRILPGGLKQSWCRDSLGRPTHHEVTLSNRNLFKREYVWNKNNKLEEFRDSNNLKTQYAYNSGGSLQSARYEDGTFDTKPGDFSNGSVLNFATNNRQYTDGGRLKSYRKNGNTIYCAYDGEGRLIGKYTSKKNIFKYEWNAAGCLISATDEKGRKTEFKYDALGRRIEKKSQNSITTWLWDNNNPIHEKTESSSSDGTSCITWLFESESFVPMGMIRDNEYHSIITDHLGCPVKTISLEGRVDWSADISILGNLRNLKGSENFCPFRFPGQYADSETGLHYNRFRYYDPDCGNYISHDPLGLDATFNLYQYVFDPVGRFDPLGLFDDWDIAPYGNKGHTNDGLDAHEMLQSKWLREHGHGNRNGSVGRKNPAMALDPELHKEITRAQRANNLFDTDTIRKQSALDNIEANRKILKEKIKDKLIKDGVPPRKAAAKAKKITDEMAEQAKKFYNDFCT